MVAKAFVDTNILLRSIFVEMDRHEEADELIKQMVNDDTELWISGQVIREFIVQSTHPRTLDEPLIIEEVEVEIKKIKRFYQIADETATVRDTLIDLLKTYPTQGKQVHDANLIATMIANDIDALLTLNIKDFLNPYTLHRFTRCPETGEPTRTRQMPFMVNENRGVVMN